MRDHPTLLIEINEFLSSVEYIKKSSKFFSSSTDKSIALQILSRPEILRKLEEGLIGIESRKDRACKPHEEEIDRIREEASKEKQNLFNNIAEMLRS